MIGERPACVDAGQVAAAVRVFQSIGLVHLRGAIAVEPLARLSAAAAAVFADRELAAQQGRLPDVLKTDYVRRFVRIDDLAIDPLTANALVQPAFLAVALSYLGREAQPAPERYVRSISPARSDTHLPFHQDESILGRALVNVWIPLAPCGVDAPGLEVVLGSWAEKLPVSPPANPRYAVEHAAIDEEAIVTRFGHNALWRPVFAVGDALLFSGRTAHRTHATPQMTRERMSVELRLI